MIDKKRYLPAVTQDGVSVFVLESTVSKKTFRNSIGSHEIIFNVSYALCRSLGCDNTDPEQEVWQINAGDFFKIVVDDVIQGFLKIIGHRHENEVVGYIRSDDLEKLERKGLVTRADLRHPKYEITKTEVKQLGTGCGDRIEEGEERKVEAGIEIAFPILKNFGLEVAAGMGKKRTLKVTRAYGGDNKQYSFFIYKLKNNRTKDSFELYAQLLYTCEGAGTIQTLKKIEDVTLIDPKSKKQYSLSFKDYKTPDDLFSFTNSPYLFSINKFEHYKELMDRLGTLFDDRALAGFFLSEFNRSSNSQNRHKPKCQNYSYKED